MSVRGPASGGERCPLAHQPPTTACSGCHALGVIPPRLRPLLGRDLSSVRAEHLERLVGLTEDEDLDVKVAVPPLGSDSERRKLVSDIAAFANRAGGLIVIGMAEDAQARITDLRPVSLLGTELETRLQQAVASAVRPPALFRVQPVLNSDGLTGFFLIAMPPSANAPHAVIVKRGLAVVFPCGGARRRST